MTTFDELSSFMSQEPVLQDLDENGIKAVILTLMLIVQADGQVLDDELNEFEVQLFELPWMKDRPAIFKPYISQAATRAQDAVSNHTTQDVFDEIAGELTPPNIREKVLHMAAFIAGSDEDVHDNERHLLQQLAHAFDLPSDKVTSALQTADV